jgi:hypothetical protein
MLVFPISAQTNQVPDVSAGKGSNPTNAEAMLFQIDQMPQAPTMMAFIVPL